jgi:tetratricopeptide (TPR) repeat protein
MRSIRLRIADLYEFDGQQPADGETNAEDVTALVLKQFSFLPQPLAVAIEGADVVISFPDESASAQAEASRLADKAAKRASSGDFQRAIELLKRSLQLQPSLRAARRDLAMCLMETGDIEEATNHLIEVLRLDPADAANWVVLGNLYLGHRKDKVTAAKFLKKAVTIDPSNAWALNSLAAIAQMEGRHDEAIALFEQAIAAQPTLANPYHGQGLAYMRAGRPEEASESLMRLFRMGLTQDARTRTVYEQARGLYAVAQNELAERRQPEVEAAIRTYRSEMERLSGFPIITEDGTFTDGTRAQVQMAWKHRRDHHLLLVRKDCPQMILSHLEAHELTHIRLESEARQAGRNRLFTTNAVTSEAALRTLAPHARKLQQAGYPEESVATLHHTLVSGLCGLVYNYPQDIIIEHYLHSRFPVLRPAQFVSVRVMTSEALAVNTRKDIASITPRRIHEAVVAINGVYCLSMDELFGGASAFADPYRSLDGFANALRLHRHWLSRKDNLSPGDEFILVDEFADILGIRDWYEWKDSLDSSGKQGPSAPEGVTNDDLLRRKHPAAVRHLLRALERYHRMPPELIQEVTFEIGRLGQSGIDYGDAEPKYRLDALPNETFTGLELMCLLFAGLKRLYPETETGMDLNEPFLTALELFHGRREQGE